MPLGPVEPLDLTPNAARVSAGIVRGTAVGLVVCAVWVEAGWALDIPVLKSLVPGFIGMNPTTAALFLLSALALYASQKNLAWSGTFVRVISALMIGLGATKLGGYAFGQNLPVDRLLFYAKLDPSGPFQGNALAPNTAICFVLMGLALPPMVRADSPFRRWPQVLVLATMSVGIFALVGYAFTSLVFYKVKGYAPMALPTALCFEMLGIGILATRPAQGVYRLFTQNGLGTMITRRLLPVAVFVPLLLGLSRALVVERGWFTPGLAAALSTLINMALLAGVILWTARALNRTSEMLRSAQAEQVLMAEQLRNEVARADEASLAKSAFLANMSHEIRTPLNGVTGMIYLLQRTALTPEQRGYMDTINGSSDALLSIINDIIDVSKIEAGKMNCESIPFDPKAVLVEVARLFSLAAQEKGIVVGLSIPWGETCEVIGDPVRFRQVATNLVSNAVKFTLRGEVRIGMTAERHGDYCELNVEISDSGIGIASDRLASVFESFTQAEDGTTRRFGGSGLGLTITKRLIEIMGGSITVSSRLGSGSTFSIDLRLPVAGTETLPARPMRGVRALVIDPEPLGRNALVAMLRAFGSSAEGVSSIGEAVSTRLDMAFLSQSAVLEGAAWPPADLSVGKTVLVTRVGEMEHSSISMRVGASQVMSFPCSEERALEILVDQTPVLGGEAKAEEIPLEGIRVLLAEDNPVNQLVAVHMLEGLGAETVVAGTGAVVLELLDEQEFDVILMDCHMPEVDGYEATRRIRLLSGPVRNIPILAATASALDGDRSRCDAAGMDGYVFKPMRPDDLRREILRVVRPAASLSGR